MRQKELKMNNEKVLKYFKIKMDQKNKQKDWNN